MENAGIVKQFAGKEVDIVRFAVAVDRAYDDYITYVNTAMPQEQANALHMNKHLLLKALLDSPEELKKLEGRRVIIR